MNAKHFLILILSSLVVLHGCKELDPDEPYQLTLADFLENNKPALQTFTVQAGVETEIHGAKGCTINFGANSFVTMSGTPVTTGNIEIQLREVTTKKDMVLSRTPTISNNELIISKGVYFLKALQNGFELRVKNFTITKDMGSPLDIPDIFLGGIPEGQDDFTWITNDSLGIVEIEYFRTDSAVYILNIVDTYFNLQNYNWINSDFFYNPSVPRVSLFFTTNDTISDYFFQSYLIFNDLNAIWPYGSHSASQLEFYNIPTGLDATLVTYYIVDGKVFVATADITTSDALSTPITFTETTEQGLLSILEEL